MWTRLFITGWKYMPKRLRNERGRGKFLFMAKTRVKTMYNPEKCEVQELTDGGEEDFSLNFGEYEKDPFFNDCKRYYNWEKHEKRKQQRRARKGILPRRPTSALPPIVHGYRMHVSSLGGAQFTPNAELSRKAAEKKFCEEKMSVFELKIFGQGGQLYTIRLEDHAIFWPQTKTEKMKVPSYGSVRMWLNGKVVFKMQYETGMCHFSQNMCRTFYRNVRRKRGKKTQTFKSFMSDIFCITAPHTHETLFLSFRMAIGEVPQRRHGTPEPLGGCIIQ